MMPTPDASLIGDTTGAAISAIEPTPIKPPFRAIRLLGFVWGAGFLITALGVIDVISWNTTWATIEAFLLIIAPICAIAGPGETTSSAPTGITPRYRPIDGVLCGLAALSICSCTGFSLGSLPPAYHDEYSYLFQAECIARGTWSIPSHPDFPELFDQFHLLNEGRMGSRYYPGTGIWLALFVMAGVPYLGHWLASAAAAFLIHGAGTELGGRRCGLLAGVIFALLPSVAMFGNLLLAHQPTMVGLSLFLWGMLRALRTDSYRDFLVAGVGLSYAMLCRPMTAAGIGLPFGIWFVVHLLRQESRRTCVTQLISLGLPLIAGWGVMASYNRDLTGELLVSPYQRYTEIYTPRHVFGFNNAVRGMQSGSRKIIKEYDEWAENLTAERALSNGLTRLLVSWMWSIGVPSAAMLMSLVVLNWRNASLGVQLLLLSLISLHGVHLPYWYDGILHFHYVLESILPLALLAGCTLSTLAQNWRREGRVAMVYWLVAWTVVAIGGFYVPIPGEGPSRFSLGLGTVAFPRQMRGRVQRAIELRLRKRPALVLIEPGTEGIHSDLVANPADWNSQLLIGRYDRIGVRLDAIEKSFPGRTIYWMKVQNQEILFREIGSKIVK